MLPHCILSSSLYLLHRQSCPKTHPIDIESSLWLGCGRGEQENLSDEYQLQTQCWVLFMVLFLLTLSSWYLLQVSTCYEDHTIINPLFLCFLHCEVCVLFYLLLWRYLLRTLNICPKMKNGEQLPLVLNAGIWATMLLFFPVPYSWGSRWKERCLRTSNLVAGRANILLILCQPFTFFSFHSVLIVCCLCHHGSYIVFLFFFYINPG